MLHKTCAAQSLCIPQFLPMTFVHVVHKVNLVRMAKWMVTARVLGEQSLLHLTTDPGTDHIARVRFTSMKLTRAVLAVWIFHGVLGGGGGGVFTPPV